MLPGVLLALTPVSTRICPDEELDAVPVWIVTFPLTPAMPEVV